MTKAKNIIKAEVGTRHPSLLVAPVIRHLSFVIMLLDLKAEERHQFNKFAVATGAISVGAVGLLFIQAILSARYEASLSPLTLEGATRPLGRMLFTDYLLPFEMLSVLLLVAM